MAEDQAKKTVKCPMHGNPLTLVRNGKGDKFEAICNCATMVVENRWKGQAVYSEPAADYDPPADDPPVDPSAADGFGFVFDDEAPVDPPADDPLPPTDEDPGEEAPVDPPADDPPAAKKPAAAKKKAPNKKK